MVAALIRRRPLGGSIVIPADDTATLLRMAADRRRTKIVATLGPASATAERVRELVDAGMDAARLNLSHGSQEDHATRAAVVRDVQEQVGRPLAIIADLQGPKLRIGELSAPRSLLKGEE